MNAAPLTLAARVQRWQRVHGRHGLPWQGTQDAYRVWLSEVMLQQTQVATVLPYYARFLQHFPTVLALAQAPQDDVLALWSGLGYYSRARNLHRCAQMVVAEHNGQFPSTLQGLAQLPGIGQSTAAAIAVFCFGKREAILDGNVKRVLTRALGFDGDLASATEVQRLWAAAHELLPVHDVPSYTQGLMDLGSSLCSLRRPQCDACPLAGLCVAHAQGQAESYPIKSRRSKRSQRSNALLCLHWRGQWLLVQRPQSGVWAGLWSFAEFADMSALQARVQHWPGQGCWQPGFKHALTHFDWTLHALQWCWPDEHDAAGHAEVMALQGRWVGTEAALAMGLPAPARRLLQALDPAAVPKN